MTSKRVTMKDVAAAAGVSVMTVSYALKGSREVSEKTRKKVQKVAEKLGYIPDPLLTRLSSYRSGRARSEKGVAMAWLNLHPEEKTWNFRGSHFLEAWEGAKKRAHELGYRLDTFCVPKSGGWRRVNKMLQSRGIEGIIIGQPPPGVTEAQLDWEQFATVVIGRAIRSPELPRVMLNHVDSMQRLMDRMRAMGYRRIGLVMEAGDCAKNDFRNVGGYYGSCMKLGISEEDRIPPLTPDQLTAGNLGDWIQRWAVEGIIVHRPDQMQKFLPQLGLKIPDDIGFAHLSMHDRSPTISGLYFAPENLGSWAVDLCHWILDRDEKGLQDPSPSLILTAYEWVPGQTLRKVPLK
ncbi:MAG: LacI family DNA-binding transcriptional regulator [Oceanipulchritudo sp.]